MKLSFRRRDLRRAAGCGCFVVMAVASVVMPRAVFGEVGVKRFPVTMEMVVTAMRYRQLPVEGVQVSLAAPITASTDNPMLDIQTVTQTGPRSAQLRIICRNRTQCLPFYAAARWPDTTAGISLPATPHRRAEELKSAAEQVKEASGVAVKAGSSATLLIEDKKIHIRLQVVCLQDGIAGDKVRVSTLDHKLAYQAEIVAPNLLKGSF